METLVRVFFAITLVASVMYIGARAFTTLAEASVHFHDKLRDQ